MNKGFGKVIVILILAAVATGGALVVSSFSSSIDEPLVACTADAMQCPDGSYVGRVAPDCEFEKCPGAGVVACDADLRACPDGTMVACDPLTGEYGPCPSAVACQEDAKQCPDGTSVVRIPPSCEFAPCAGGDGVLREIRGSTRTGICPTIESGSSELCSAEVIGIFYLLKGNSFIAQTSSDRTGQVSFVLNLYDGDYEITNQYSKVVGSAEPFKFPICSHRFTVEAGINHYNLGTIWCDSGIQ